MDATDKVILKNITNGKEREVVRSYADRKVLSYPKTFIIIELWEKEKMKLTSSQMT